MTLSSVNGNLRFDTHRAVGIGDAYWLAHCIHIRETSGLHER
jgi:hypothetical protein